jgi:hypothetical protein
MSDSCPPTLSAFPKMLCDLFTPTLSVESRYNDFLTTLHTKWPFNIVVQLHTFDSPGSLPIIGDHIGMFPISDLSPLFTVVRIVSTSALTFFFIFSLVNWLTPQVKV